MTAKNDGVTHGFMQRVGFVILAAAAAFLVFKLLGLWQLIFGAVIIAVILRGLAEPLIRFARLNEKLAVVAALLIVLGLIVSTFYLFGVQLVAQTEGLAKTLPEAWAALQARINGSPIGPAVQSQVGELGQQAGGWLSRVPAIAGNVLSSVANLLVALVAGVTLAMNPGRYRDGIVRVFPADQRPRILESLNATGVALSKWFIGQFISMVLVGTLTGIGLAILGVPSALALGMLSGLAQFVPVVGPILSAGPGLLLAAMGGWNTFLIALAIYVGVSQLEANIITPMVQRQVASVPMVLTLFAVIGFAGLLGPMGVLYAMPLTVIGYTFVLRYMKGRDGSPATESEAATD